MHELSLCGAIADIVTRRAEDRSVDVIHVRIGQLRQVIPDTLLFCWSLVVAETTLEGAELQIERVAARLKCRACGDEFDLGNNVTFGCPACGGLDSAVLAGEEFLVTALDLGKV
ncbi:MAG: hydrogenase maturation nickel metallochaperone HypA [Mycobacteriales bacterium]